jgi:hypothetical protein
MLHSAAHGAIAGVMSCAVRRLMRCRLLSLRLQHGGGGVGSWQAPARHHVHFSGNEKRRGQQ